MDLIKGRVEYTQRQETKGLTHTRRGGRPTRLRGNTVNCILL